MGLLAEIAIVAAVLVVSARYGTRPALVGAVTVGGVLVFVSLELLLVFGASSLCGILLDDGRRAQASFGHMMTTALLPAGLVVVALAAFPPFNAEEIAQEFISGVAGSERWLQGLYPEGNAPGALQDTLVFLLRLAPGAGFLSMLLAAFAAYVLCQRWFLRHRVELPAIPPFSCWKIWDHLVWLLALGIGLVLLGNARAAAVGWNLILVMGALYLLQGLAVLRFRLSRSRIPRPAAIVFYAALVLTLSVSLFVVVGLGILDIWIPLRRDRTDALT